MDPLSAVDRRSSQTTISLILCSILALFTAQLSAGEPPISMPPVKNVDMSLQRLANRIGQGASTQVEARKLGLSTDERGRIKVILWPWPGEVEAIDLGTLQTYGAAVHRKNRSVVIAYVPPEALNQIASRVPGVREIRPPAPLDLHEEASEGVELVGALSYHDAQVLGAGVRVAVIDTSFGRLIEAINAGEFGELPGVIDSSCTYNYSTNEQGIAGVNSFDGSEHGSRVAQIVYDMAPQATLCLKLVAEPEEIITAAGDIATENVDIVAMSLGVKNLSYYDGTGELSDAVSSTSGEVLWVVGAGNQANDHWRGLFRDGADDDRIHDFSTSPRDETNNSTFLAEEGETLQVRMTWDDWPMSNIDYDVYLLRGIDCLDDFSDVDDLQARALEPFGINFQTGTQAPAETISYTVPAGTPTDTYCFAIAKKSQGDDREITVFTLRETEASLPDFVPEYRQRPQSLDDPAVDDDVLAVGAVPAALWNTGQQPMDYYSAQGPRNVSRYSATPVTKPDITGPTNVTVFGPGIFTGTSAATPHVAGCAALHLSQQPTLNSYELRQIVEGTGWSIPQVEKNNSTGSGLLDCSRVTFADVKYSDWFFWYLALLRSRGVVDGLGDGVYSPDTNVSRAETLKIAYESSGEMVIHPVPLPPFIDVGPEDWFFEYVADAYSKEYVEGTACGADQCFFPNQASTRAEAVKMLSVLFQANNAGVPVINVCPGDLESFGDVPSSYWAYAHIHWMANAELRGGPFRHPIPHPERLIRGYGGGEFRPDELVNRAEIAKVAANTLLYFESEPDPPSCGSELAGTSNDEEVSLGRLYEQVIDPSNPSAPSPLAIPGGNWQVATGPVTIAGDSQDMDGDNLFYFWSASGGTLETSDPINHSTVTWTPPEVLQDTLFTLHVERGDRRGGVGRSTFHFLVLGTTGDNPSSGNVTSPNGTHSGEVTVSATASDPDGLERVWVTFVSGGTELDLCSGSGIPSPCPSTSGNLSLTAVDPATFGAVAGTVTLRLWIEDVGGSQQLVDSHAFNYAPPAPGPGFDLTVLKQGDGDGTISGGGLTCAPGCSSTSVTVPEGAQVTLTGTPAPGSLFVGFAGDRCYGVDPCTFTMIGDLTVRASFGLPESLGVLYTVPSQGDTGVSPTAQPRIVFNREILEGPNFGGIGLFEEVSGVPVDSVAVISTQHPEWLFLLPDSSLARGISYRVDIPAGAVVDSTGSPLQSPLSLTFTIANEDAPRMYLAAYPTRILEGEETRVSVWFETPAAVDRTLVFSSTPPGELLHPTEITLPAGEVLAEVVVDTRLDHGSITDKAVTLQVSEAAAGQVSLQLSIPNETPVTGACLKWLAAGVIEDDDGDGQLEADEFGTVSLEVANFCGSTILNVILETRVVNTTNLDILGGNPPCHLGALSPGQSKSCERDIRADDDLPTGDYFIEVSGTSSANSILDLARIPVVNNFLPDYEVPLGTITSNELDPGTVIDLPLTARNRGDGFNLLMPRFEVHIELEGQEYLLYRTYANVRGDIWHQQSFELPLVVPPVPGTHQIRVTINPPGPEQLDESDFGDNDGFFTLHVASPNEAPVLDLIGSPIAVVSGQALSFAVTAHDANGDTLSFALLDGPASATLQSTGPQSALFQWTPPADHPVQSVPVEIEVTDGIEIDSLMVILDVEHQADLSITVDDGLELAVPGQSLVYTIQVQSSGPSIAAGLVAAEFPWLDDVSWSCSATSGSSCGASGTQQIADPVQLVPGGSATYTVQGVLAPDASGVVTQEAEVVPSAPTADPIAGNNVASDSTSLRDLDFGDAPDVSFGAPWTFPTLLAADGARHGIDPALALGSAVDGELDGQPSLGAMGDDASGTADEDGVVLPAELIPCLQAPVEVSATSPGMLDAWVDFDGDGDWDDPAERIFDSEPLVAGTNPFTLEVPCSATPSALVFARFRFSSVGGLAPGGLSLDGEVEDHAVAIGQVLHTLEVLKTGPGNGTVVASPTGINCGADCSHSYPAGTAVVLSTDPDVGSVFSGWSGGGCTGTAPCSLTMDTAHTVTATFDLASFGLTIAKDGDGEGTVSSDPVGIDCGSDCNESFLYGTPVTVSAVAAPDSEFMGWSDGGCTGTSPCVVTIEEETSVTATFQRTSYSLTVELDGEGAGNVSSDPAGIICGNECTASFPKDTSVDLTTIPVRWSTFGGWSGDCTGQGDCTVVLDRDVLVTARFDALCLDLLETGSGNWQVLAGPNDNGLSSPWALVSDAGRDGTIGWFVPNEPLVTDQLLELRTGTTVTTGAPVLKFWQQFDTEPGRDGGVLEYSVDGGLTWWDILEGDGGAIPSNPARILTGDYTGVLDTCCSNPLPGRQAWTGQSNQWQQVTVDLTDFAGNAVHFRWRFGADSSVAEQGWTMDEIIVLDTENCPLPAIFADGFESGDTGSWSQAVP